MIASPIDRVSNKILADACADAVPRQVFPIEVNAGLDLPIIREASVSRLGSGPPSITNVMLRPGTGTTTLLQLPDHVLCKVLNHATPSALSHLSRTCTQLRSLVLQHVPQVALTLGKPLPLTHRETINRAARRRARAARQQLSSPVDCLPCCPNFAIIDPCVWLFLGGVVFVAQRLWAVAVLMWCGVVILFTRNPAAVAQRSQHQQRQVLLAGQQLRSRVEALDLTIRADPGSGKKIRVMQLAAERLIEVLAAPTDIESGDTGAHGVKRLALQRVPPPSVLPLAFPSITLLTLADTTIPTGAQLMCLVARCPRLTHLAIRNCVVGGAATPPGVPRTVEPITTLPAKLRTLIIKVDTDGSGWCKEADALVAALGPQLQHLMWHQPWQEAPSQRTAASILATCTQLKTVDVLQLPATLTRVLAALPHLRDVTCETCDVAEGGRAAAVHTASSNAPSVEANATWTPPSSSHTLTQHPSCSWEHFKVMHIPRTMVTMADIPLYIPRGVQHIAASYIRLQREASVEGTAAIAACMGASLTGKAGPVPVSSLTLHLAHNAPCGGEPCPEGAHLQAMMAGVTRLTRGVRHLTLVWELGYGKRLGFNGSHWPVTSEVLRTLGAACPLLRTLIIRCGPDCQWEPNAWGSITTALPSLRDVTVVMNLLQLGASGQSAITQWCQGRAQPLRLRLSHCEAMTTRTKEQVTEIVASIASGVPQGSSVTIRLTGRSVVEEEEEA